MTEQKLRVIKNSRRRRRQRFRRFLTMAVIVSVFGYMTHSIYATRREQLEEVQAELASYQAILDEIMLRQGFYENQVTRLEDPDYIAMLARQRYFRSLPNEIIFRIIDGVGEPPDLNYEYQN